MGAESSSASGAASDAVTTDAGSGAEGSGQSRAGAAGEFAAASDVESPADERAGEEERPPGARRRSAVAEEAGRAGGPRSTDWRDRCTRTIGEATATDRTASVAAFWMTPGWPAGGWPTSDSLIARWPLDAAGLLARGS